MRDGVFVVALKVSYTHIKPEYFKTDAPSKVIWDIYRCVRPLSLSL